MDTYDSLAGRILDTAVDLAGHSSWEKLQLHQVARDLQIGLVDVHECYAQKDDLVEAWYDRADRAMLSCCQQQEFASLSTRQRLHGLIMAWLDQLASDKKVSRDMLLYKLEPAHLHLQLQGMLRVSRTVQWLREAAGIDSSHLRRIGEEVILTGLFLDTFRYWLFDASAEHKKTRRYLDRRLGRVEQLAKASCWNPVAGKRATPFPAGSSTRPEQASQPAH